MTLASDSGRDVAPLPPVKCRSLVCFAVKEEARFFQAPHDCRILVHGMGKPSAVSALERQLSSLQPRLVLSCGFAGGLDPALEVGSVVYEADEGLPEFAELSRHLGSLGARPVRFHGAERVAVTAGEKRDLRRSTGADAVEMESSAICAFCRERDVKVMTLRAISDVAGEDLPLDFNRLITASGGIHWVRLAGQLMARPGKIPRLIQLQRNSALAARRLGHVLQELLVRFR